MNLTAPGPLGQVCFPCSHFESGFLEDRNSLARTMLRYPVDAEFVRRIGGTLMREAAATSGENRLIVHVEKGRTMCRITITGVW